MNMILRQRSVMVGIIAVISGLVVRDLFSKTKKNKYNSVNGKKIFNDVRDCCRVYFSIPTSDDSHIYVGAILNHTKQCY